MNPRDSSRFANGTRIRVPVLLSAVLLWAAQLSAQAPSPKTIPTYQVRVEGQKTFPYQNVALRFQFMELEEKQTRFFMPLGDGCFDPQGRLLLCFPKANAVIRFSQPHYDLSFFGPKAVGGQGETLISPIKIAAYADGSAVVNGRHKQILLYGRDFKLDRALALESDLVWPGPAQKFLVGAPDRPNDLMRVTSQNRPEVFYSLPSVPGYHRDGQAIVANISPNWEAALARLDGSQAYHLDPSGSFLARFAFDFSPAFTIGSESFPAGILVEGFIARDNRYYLLFSAPREAARLRPQQPAARGEKGQARVSYLLSFDRYGGVTGFWETPFYCDGFCMDDKSMAIYYKKTAKVMALRLN